MEEHGDEIKAEIATLFPEGTDFEAVKAELKEAGLAKEKVMAVLQKYEFNFEAAKAKVSLVYIFFSIL